MRKLALSAMEDALRAVFESPHEATAEQWKKVLCGGDVPKARKAWELLEGGNYPPYSSKGFLADCAKNCQVNSLRQEIDKRRRAFAAEKRNLPQSSVTAQEVAA